MYRKYIVIYIVGEKIAKYSRNYSEGEFVKECVELVVEKIVLVKKQKTY